MASADRLIEIFNEAKARPAGPERDHFLSEACRDEPVLKKQVLSLLQAHEAAGDFLKNQQTTPPITVLTEKPGDRIGRYKLLEQIGEGGCGVVYMAEQEEPVRRRVALKVIKLGMDTKQVVARFEAEGQALAMMDHPSIAKVFDAGATNTGRPFFVMELVRGIKITDYCDQNNLPTEHRLKLFIQVCHAIQHAHQKGIIHRDIKPSNILVTVDDGAPVPKVIDFGIAKAIEHRLTDKTVFTALEQFIGTPAYMSPEQAEMTGLDIDTRADIYSLGVLLYELLTGHTPFDAKELLAAGLDEMRRKIREDEPAKPSTRLGTLQAIDLRTVAKLRHAEPPRLIHLIRGDLDWLVMKCLEKDRTRRYETANGLAAEIKRYLANEPVVARPPSKFYRFEKLARRNKFAFGAIAAVATTLVLGVVVSSWQALRATRAEYEQIRLREEADAGKRQAQTEAAKSEQVALFMKDMLKGVGPSVALGRDTAMLREILNQTARRLNELKGQPDVEADLRDTLGIVYRELSEYTNATTMHQEALAIRRKLHGNESLDVAATLNNLGQALHPQSKWKEAEACYREALVVQRRLLGETHADVATTLDHLGSVLRAQSKHDEAEKVLRDVLAMRLRLFPADHLDVAQSLFNLSLDLAAQSKFEEAEQLQRKGLAMRRKLLPVDHPDVAEALAKLGKTLALQKKFPEAETDLREAVAMQRKLLFGKNRDLANTLQSLGDVLRDQNKLPEAESCYRESLAMFDSVYGGAFQDTSGLSTKLITVLRAQGKKTEAVEIARAALAAYKKRAGSENVEIALDALGQTLLQAGEQTEAEAVMREAIAVYKKLGDDKRTADALTRLANSHRQAHKNAEAEELHREALALCRKLGDDKRTADAVGRLAISLMQQYKFAEAEQSYREGLALRRKVFGNEHLAVAISLASVADVLNAQGKYLEAEGLARESIGVLKKLPGDQNQALSRSIDILSIALLLQGRLPEVFAAYREILALGEKLPGYLPVLNEYAWILATCPDSKFRDGVSAVKFAENAIASTDRTNVVYLDTLAAAYAETGRFTNAVSVQQEVIALSASYVEKTEYASRLKLYASNAPYRDESLLINKTQARLDEGKFAEAELAARECLALCEQQIPENWTTFNVRNLLGRSLLGQKKYAEAESFLIAGYVGMKQRENEIADGNKRFMKETLQHLARLYEATGQSEKSAEWNKKVSEFDEAEAKNQTATSKP